MQTKFNSFVEKTWKSAETESILAALELGLFDDIESGMNTADKIVTEKGYHLETVKSVLKMIKNTGLVVQEGDCFSIAEEYKDYVLKNSDLYNGDIWRLHRSIAQHMWRYLPQMIKTGENEINMFSAEDDERWSEGMPFLNSLAKNISGSLLRQFQQEVESKENQRVLDVGCGTGVYSAKFLEANPTWSGVGIDIKRVTDIATENNKELVKQRRVKYVAGDIFDKREELGKFDVIIISNIFHGYGKEKNSELLDVMKYYLAEGGKVVVNEFIIREEEDNNTVLMFDLFFGLASSGRAFSKEALNELMTENGFKEYKELEIEGPSTGFIYERSV